MYSLAVTTPPWTLRSLAKRTFSLLRSHPVLIVPVLVADLIGFAAMHLQHALHQPLFDLILAGHGSVLSATHDPFVLTPENAMKAFMLTFPLIWGSYLLNGYCYATALRLISKLFEAIHNGTPFTLQFVRVTLFQKKGTLLLFSALLVVALWAAIALAGFCVSQIVFKFPRALDGMVFEAGALAGLLALIPVIWMLIRPTFGLLQPAGAVTARSVYRLAFLSGVIAVSAQFALGILMKHATQFFFTERHSVYGFLFAEAILSLVGSLPFVPFFLALSLLAADGKGDADLVVANPLIDPALAI